MSRSINLIISKNSQEEYGALTKLAMRSWRPAGSFLTGDPAGELAKAAELHRRWLSFTDSYSKAHAGLAQMYVDDPRFTAYYDKKQPGTAEFLRMQFLFTQEWENKFTAWSARR